MNRQEKEKIAEGLKDCYKCSMEIDKEKPYFIEDFFNSKVEKMDVRLECFDCRFKEVYH